MDRGVIREDNVAPIQSESHGYIVGTPDQMPGQYERELSPDDWELIRKG
jgi:hypothetical protein